MTQNGRFLVILLVAGFGLIIQIGLHAEKSNFKLTEQEAKGLVLSLNFNKNIFVLGEPIIVQSVLKNKGGMSVDDHWFSFGIGFYLELETDTGQPVMTERIYTERARILTDWAATLSSGQTITTANDLTRGDPVGTSPTIPRIARGVIFRKGKITGYAIAPGTYRLIASHDLRKHKLPDGGRIRLETSKEFTVRAPEGREKEALALFETQAFFSGEGAEESQKHALAAYDKIWKEYRATPFSPYALYYSARILQTQGKLNEAEAKYSLLLEQFPDFPLLADALYYQTLIERALKQTDKAQKSALKLREKFKNHLVAPDVPMKNRAKGSRVLILLKDMGLKDE